MINTNTSNRLIESSVIKIENMAARKGDKERMTIVFIVPMYLNALVKQMIDKPNVKNPTTQTTKKYSIGNKILKPRKSARIIDNKPPNTHLKEVI